MTDTTGEKEKLQRTLKGLRDQPVSSEDARPFLAPLFDFLVKVPVNSNDGLLHWFCDRSYEPLVSEAATFLLRLHAYNSSKVQQYKKLLAEVLTGCAGCVKGLQEAKVTSRKTYFDAFDDVTIAAFWSSFADWERQLIMEALTNNGVTPTSTTRTTLADLPLPVFYHLFSHPSVFNDSEHPEMRTYISQMTPSKPRPTLPYPPPPALISALVDENVSIRDWATQQFDTYQPNSLREADLMKPYHEALQRLLQALSHSPLLDTHMTTDQGVLWSGLAIILRFLPLDAPSHRELAIELRRVVCKHLEDTDLYFESVLQCVTHLFRRLGSHFWDREDLSFPQAVFNRIKDNPNYLRILSEHPKEDCHVQWLSEYLNTFDGQFPAWGEALERVMTLLCGDPLFQTNGDARSPLVNVAAQLSRAAMAKAEKHVNGLEWPALVASTCRHADVFVQVAFSVAYASEDWAQARDNCRSFLESVLRTDIASIQNGIRSVCQNMYKEAPLLQVNIHKRLWESMFRKTRPDDADAARILLGAITPSAQFDLLNESAFIEAFKRKAQARSTVEDVNAQLSFLYEEFGQAISNFANTNTSQTMSSFLRRPGVANEIVALLMSPVDALQTAGQVIISQAFDVDGRPEAFRALFERLPVETYEGIITFLDMFMTWAANLTEACSLSKSVVRCLTDIIDVLCTTPDGLLLGDLHFQPCGDQKGRTAASNVYDLWTSMTKISTIIFKRTPMWARTLGEAPETRLMMVTWMRDALLFGRDMVGQRQTIEDAAVRAHKLEHPTSKSGPLKRDMTVSLKPVLDEITRWLRLSEPELLFQSFELLDSLLQVLRRMDVRPDAEALARLNKQVGNKETRLDTARVARLKGMLADLDDASDEDEVQIVGESIPGPVVESVIQIPAKVIQISAKTLGSTIPKKPSASVPRASGKLAEIRRAALSTQPVLSKKDIIRAPPQVGPSIAGPKQQRHGQILASTRAGQGRPNHGSYKDAGTRSGLSSEAPSSSDDEDDDQDEPKGLAALASMEKTPKIKKPAERRTVKMMDDMEIGMRRSHQERLHRRDDARRTAMRLKPDVSSLHRIILAWDYNKAIEGGLPPNVQSIRPTHVANSFNSYQDYRRTFESLLILEAWAGLAQSKDEPRERYQITIVSRQTVDDWTDMDIKMNDTVIKDWYLTDSDIVLIRRTGSDNSLLAKVQSYKATPNAIQGSLRIWLSPGAPDPGIFLNSVWTLEKVFALTTIHREYGALMSLEYYDFLNFILRPHLTRSSNFNADEVERTMRQYGLNEPQAKAILGALQSQDFSLIQGPPGTGKTTTICGLVKACLSKRARPLADPSRPNEKVALPKILVCAPSNAAIDEVASRLKEKVENVVRLGSDKSINVSVKDISLDSLIDAKLAQANFGEDNLKDVGKQVRELRSKLDTVKTSRQNKENALAEIRNDPGQAQTLEEDIRKLKQQRTALTQQLDKLRDQQRDGTRTLDSMRRRFRSEVIQEADVICSTLSGAGHDILESFNSFEMVVIDEAAQAIELSSLIPLKYLCKRCVMVGDPQQLPPTVLSLEAKKYKYDQSLFVRLQKQRPEAVNLLSIQYRMHPEISQLPSEVFYSGRLQDGPGMAEKTKQAWHTSAMFPPYQFFNVQGQEAPAASGSSLVNRTEAQVAAALYNRLQKDFPLIDLSFRVGIVSMYRAQIIELKKVFRERFGMDILGKVDFNTVDGFQGQEKDIIILSCVRASPGGMSVGFLADVRRMNVALTRARSSLFVLGNATTLQRGDETWKNIVENAKSRSQLVEGTTAYFQQAGRAPAPQAAVPALPKGKKRKASPEPTPDDLFAPQGVKKKAAVPHVNKSLSEQSEVTRPSTNDVEMRDGTSSKASSPPDTRASTPMSEAVVPKPNPAPPPARPVGNSNPRPPPKKKLKPKAEAALFIPRKKPT